MTAVWADTKPRPLGPGRVFVPSYDWRSRLLSFIHLSYEKQKNLHCLFSMIYSMRIGVRKPVFL
ncbi:MAG TPA: hypothetical protein DCZ48_01205 [Methylococcaceae bacterium]|nr:hypothetical protein [Methylococcaceae bacterium]